ncbi:SDR family oxidoreductase [Bermanella marisrubri]|uniref:NAD-dependent epimerase/dehydratase:Short-chain dehydrogenase/reductase SDR:3-beta hydroxysteroid n=1 Tax=Bermanella marisrubri TaxID=207949 RepID=Q1N5G9_9GAMM|nr:SDR family oxidoreductase [Bermanella marisrubri]EAT13973.1 NAD-dependent epimerase/dehydratase:Short-chain dehydrogenase/reductase SDR:3-beta hydroxysteroid [Oceanobacter sp. RED65] [Bermanella marisrubri]QIZ84721.1 SDR family oxidoreductase [Bermanella marisrubri]
MHAFITGASGFIGQHLVKCLLTQGWQVTALTRKHRGHHLQHPDLTWVEGNICSLKHLLAAMPNQPDAVYHLACDTRTCATQVKQQFQTNVMGTHNVLQAALSKNAARVIYTSTIAVYGFHHDEVDEHSEKRAIDSPVAYYRSKYLAEELVREYIRKGIDAVILNPSSVIGPLDERNWIQLFDRIHNGSLIGIPPGSKSFSYVEDVAKAHVQAFIYGRCGENYILSGPSGSFDLVCRWVSQRLNTPLPRGRLPAWWFKCIGATLSLVAMITRKQPIMSLHEAHLLCADLTANCDKAKRELQYQVSLSLPEMLESTYQWWKQKQSEQTVRHPAHMTDKQYDARDIA